METATETSRGIHSPSLCSERSPLDRTLSGGKAGSRAYSQHARHTIDQTFLGLGEWSGERNYSLKALNHILIQIFQQRTDFSRKAVNEFGFASGLPDSNTCAVTDLWRPSSHTH